MNSGAIPIMFVIFMLSFLLMFLFSLLPTINIINIIIIVIVNSIFEMLSKNSSLIVAVIIVSFNLFLVS